MEHPLLRNAALIACMIPAFFIQPAFSASDPVSALERPERVSVYQQKTRGGKLLLIPMDFAGSRTDVVAVRSKLKDAQVACVEVVYTDFPKGRDLTALNQQRLDKLRELAPELFAEAHIEWRVIAQTSPRTEAEARALFHGVVITYRPPMTALERKAEIARIKDLFKKEGAKTEEVTTRSTSPMMEERLTTLFDSLPARRGTDAKHRMVREGDPRVGPVTLTMGWWSSDSTVIRVLERNTWKNAVITADLTGSMTPYTAQIILWVKLKTMEPVKRHWVFFNDGDSKPDNKKMIGSTGGIYKGYTKSYDELQALAIKTMSAGSGGDAPENNIEALLAAQAKCDTCELVMVADNWAPIKDRSLMAKVKRPVHVILCGVAGAVNTDYLDLARTTGGSVHTMEADLTRLSELNEGSITEIGGQFFKIKNGELVRIEGRSDRKSGW